MFLFLTVYTDVFPNVCILVVVLLVLLNPVVYPFLVLFVLFVSDSRYHFWGWPLDFHHPVKKGFTSDSLPVSFWSKILPRPDRRTPGRTRVPFRPDWSEGGSRSPRDPWPLSVTRIQYRPTPMGPEDRERSSHEMRSSIFPSFVTPSFVGTYIFLNLLNRIF